MDNDNDETPAGQRDAPGAEAAHDVKRSWTSVLANDANQLAVGGTLMAMGYGAKKAADKIRKPQPPPPPTPPPSGDSQGGQE